MKAKELIARLGKLIESHHGEDLDILIPRDEGWYDIVTDLRVVYPERYNDLVCPGVELVRSIKLF